MVTSSEFLRWFVYRLSAFYTRVAVRVMRRDVLLLGSERKFRALIEFAPDAMVIVDWHGHIALVNGQAERLLGWRRDDLVGQNLAEIIPERLRHAHREHWRRYTKSPRLRPMAEGRELFARRRDGTEFPVEISLGPLETTEGLLVCATIRDITERKAAEGLLRRLADHDGLTGLLNRRTFEEELEREVARAARYGGDGAVVLIDIDGLKDVNDTLGHACGDELIRSVAQLVAGRMRETDVVARIGGDEFAVLMPQTTLEDAVDVAERLSETIRAHGIVLGAKRLRLSASMGVANLAHGVAAGEDVLVAADLALYDAKEAGRARVAVRTQPAAARTQPPSRAAWSQRIREALDQERLVAYRQPVMDVASRTVSQYELLVRMQEGGAQPTLPGAFLPTAERTGMVRDVDRVMVGHALALLGCEPAGSQTVYEVNISSRSLTDPALAVSIERMLATSGTDPARLVFEITETAAIANIDQARGFADAMRALGCAFALDGFGAGFASFSSLEHIPLDWLKIDGGLVRNLRTNATDRVVVQHMVEIARSLGMRTIAEYVENRETLDLLTEYGVDCAQGHHIGVPEPALPGHGAARAVPAR